MTTVPPVRPSLSPVRTARLCLRCWNPGDAALLKDALDTSLAELRPWMPWAAQEPSTVEAVALRLERFQRAFVEGSDWTYGVFDDSCSRVLGGAGLHPRLGPGRLEIGYWIRTAETGQGFATEAAGALTELAFRSHGVEAVEIRCDPRNARSAAIPRRLGYRHVTTLLANQHDPAGKPRDTLVWERLRPAAGESQ